MDRTDIESNKEKYVTVECDCGMVENKRFHYDYKTGRMKDTQSNTQATKDMRVLETIINDACHSYEKKIKELETRNKRQYERLKEITGLMMERDWKSLETMVKDWEEAEELLQAEWGTYCE